jgi:hypothetical protein
MRAEGKSGRPRSIMAQRLSDAFAGCDQWTVAPGRKRDAAAALAPPTWVSGGAAGANPPEAPRAQA